MEQANAILGVVHVFSRIFVYTRARFDEVRYVNVLYLYHITGTSAIREGTLNTRAEVGNIEFAEHALSRTIPTRT